MKYCKDCVHFSKKYELAFCMHPSNGVDPVYGKLRGRHAMLTRVDESKCGTEAKWYTYRFDRPSLIARIWNSL